MILVTLSENQITFILTTILIPVVTSELNLITSYGNKVKIKDSKKSVDITLPIKPLFRIFYKFRLSRRFLRLDKMNVFLICVLIAFKLDVFNS